MTSNGQSILVPSGRMTFDLEDGRGSFSLDPIDAIQEIDRIVERRKGCVNYEHLDDFREWIQKTTQGPDGPGVELTRTEADWLMDHIRERYLTGKAKRATLLNSLLQGPSSSTAQG